MSGSAGELSDAAIGVRVREARKRLDLTQAALAQRLGVEGLVLHSSAVAKIESGERSLRLAEAPAVSAALGVTLAWLVGQAEGKPPRAVDARAEQTLRRIKRLAELALPEGHLAELERQRATLIEFAVNGGADFEKVQPRLKLINEEIAERQRELGTGD